MSYEDIRRKYAISPEEERLFKIVQRKRAFDDLDAEVESYEYNDKADCNFGRPFEPTEEQVERIIDEYLDRRYSEYAVADEMEDMRDAIHAVLGLVV